MIFKGYLRYDLRHDQELPPRLACDRPLLDTEKLWEIIRQSEPKAITVLQPFFRSAKPSPVGNSGNAHLNSKSVLVQYSCEIFRWLHFLKASLQSWNPYQTITWLILASCSTNIAASLVSRLSICLAAFFLLRIRLWRNPRTAMESSYQSILNFLFNLISGFGFRVESKKKRVKIHPEIKLKSSGKKRSQEELGIELLNPLEFSIFAVI